MRLFADIAHFLFERRRLVAVAVAPLVDAPVEEIFRRGRRGERGDQNRARPREQQEIRRKTHHRGEQLFRVRPERLGRVSVALAGADGALLQFEYLRVLRERIRHHAGFIMQLPDEKEPHVLAGVKRRVLEICADRRAREQHGGKNAERREQTRNARALLHAAHDLRREQQPGHAGAGRGERFYERQDRHVVPARLGGLPQHPPAVLPQTVARFFPVLFFHRNHLFFSGIL